MAGAFTSVTPATPDLLVVGAGAAGVSAALWARSLQLDVQLIEGGPRPGGQLHDIHFEPDNVALAAAGQGAALAARLAEQLARAGIAPACDTVAIGIGDEDGRPCVRTSDGGRLRAEALLVATGARKRRLGVPGERELEGRGVSTSATRDRAQLAGRRVAVAGGGDAAYENALLLARAACDVVLLVRDAPRARAEFQRAAEAEPRIAVRHDTQVTAALGTGRLEAVRIESAGRREDLAVDALVVKVGIMPNSEWCAGALALDPAGHVEVDATLRTSRPRVWAAGDVTGPNRPSLAVAIGQAAEAVDAIRRELRGD
ncbi:MAG TPA: NAD(P)/FAD-dependent oxidoreductase [Candidatus Eisenbacteria bacterium]|nr:NAD(P)/FAD-dependent oxidoreductase [Candidatus Eisenbacteria bacterium]